MKIALVHDWLTGMRGGEKCLEVFCELFPDAPIYTLFHVKGSVSQTIERHRIVTSILNFLPFSRNIYRYYLPLFPFAIRAFDLRGYDLILSSSHCVAKGVKVPYNACHISYVHTPMRYVWDQFDEYFGKGNCSILTHLGMSRLRGSFQKWDRRSNANIFKFMANSQHVAERMLCHYGKKACVIHPPVDWHHFQPSHVDEGFYLMVTASAPYKRVDLAIEAANKAGFPLKIIGKGQDDEKLRSLAGPGVEFLGWQSDVQVRQWYSRCRALLFPGEEDFGIVPLEAMASGKPVIAYGKGGVLETVLPLDHSGLSAEKSKAPTGVFFYEQSLEGIIDAIKFFETHQQSFDSDAIRAHVQKFDRAHFKQRIEQVVLSYYQEFQQSRPC